MITRSDLQMYGCSPTNFETVRSTPMETFEMEHSNIPYIERKCPSAYELSHDLEADIKGESGSVNFSCIVDEMLKPCNDTPDHRFTTSSTNASNEYRSSISKADSDIEHHSRNYTSQSHTNVMLINDEFDMQEDLETFPYSQPDTPTDSPTMASDIYSNPLSYPEYASSSPQSYKVTSSKPFSKEKKPVPLDNHYDTSSIMYDNDDMTEFTGMVNCNEVLRNHKSSSLSEHSGTIVCCYRNNSLSSPEDEGNKDNGDPGKREETDREESFENRNSPAEDADSRKGKITVLQRRALDSIFSVIDRPSRGLVLHIAGELCLHHITVKNFFSNGRRRLRRAAARLNDPERTKRENQKRKEKRRLAALAAAASAANAEKEGNGASKGTSDRGNGGDSQPSRDPPVLSPERRALMEKLAVKVQRSVAQRGLAEAGAGIKNGISEPATLPTNINPSDTFNNNNANVITMHNFQTKSSENTNFLSTSVHSSPMSFSEPMHKPFGAHSVEDFNYYNQNGEALGAIFAYSETEPISSYNSSPDQNSVSIYANEQSNTNTYELVNEEGPYSPTSWQTLIHA